MHAASGNNLGKRKSVSTSPSDEGEDADDDTLNSSTKLTATGKVSASQQLVPVPGNPDAPLVAKRTLQNRKAQREFRKRREARVKDLEERCRRYDEQGVEANMALQQIAESLKQENEALKGLLVRLGFVNMIGPTLDGARGPPGGSFPLPQQQSYTDADLSMASWAKGADAPANAAGHGAESAPRRSKTDKAEAKMQKQPSDLASRQQFHDAPLGDSVNPSLLDGSSKPATTTKKNKEDEGGPFNSDWFAQLAQAGHDKDDEEDGDAAAAPVHRATQASAQGHATDQQGQDQPSTVNPILSLSFGGNSNGKKQQPPPSQQEQNGKEREGQDQSLSLPQAQSKQGTTLAPKANDLTPNTALRDFFSDFTGPPGESNNNGASGSAMLGEPTNDHSFGLPGLSHPSGLGGGIMDGGGGNNIFPMPLPTHQNDALLNPNPIPFAFNLSNTRSPPDQSWWNQMGGGHFSDTDNSILDEKAQAVAQATAALNSSSNGGAQSPFDLSAFLTEGITPGGGFNLGPHAAPGHDDSAYGSGFNADDSLGKLKDGGDRDTATPASIEVGVNGGNSVQSLSPVEHAQMFLRLLEAKTAKQSVSPYTSLGFLPPSQMKQRPATQHWTVAAGGDSVGAAKSLPSPSSEGSDQGRRDRLASPPLTLQLPPPPSLSPLNIYSRLSQHPAFLSTDALELEELVDSIGLSQGQQQQQQQRKAGNGTLLYPTSAAGLTPSLYVPTSAVGTLATDKPTAKATLAAALDGAAVEVDEKVLDKMLGFLDQKSPRQQTTPHASGFIV